MSEEKIGVFLPFQKRTIHAVKELNFDLEILKNDPNDNYYAIIRSFYNGSNVLIPLVIRVIQSFLKEF